MSALDDLYREVAELKARLANVMRPAVVVSYDAGAHTAVVRLAGEQSETHAIQVGDQPGWWAPLKAGQQVTLLCASGDIANAMIIAGGYTQRDAKPSSRADENAVARDKAALRVRDGGFVLAEILERRRFRLIIDDRAFAIRAEALEPVPKDD